jgi:hypothetical protein
VRKFFRGSLAGPLLLACWAEPALNQKYINAAWLNTLYNASFTKNIARKFPCLSEMNFYAGKTRRLMPLMDGCICCSEQGALQEQTRLKVQKMMAICGLVPVTEICVADLGLR